MFSTDFIFRQQENLVDNQKCQAGFRPLCNKILFLPHRPNFSDIFDFCLHWVSVVRACTESKLSLLLTLPIPAAWCPNVEPVLKITWKIVS